MCNLIKALIFIISMGMNFIMKSRYVHEQESYFSNVNLTHTNTSHEQLMMFDRRYVSLRFSPTHANKRKRDIFNI